MRISYTEHVTNDEVLQRVGQDRALMGQVKSRELEYFGHVSRHNSLEKDIMLGFMPGTKRRGGQKRQWIDNVTQWSGQDRPGGHSPPAGRERVVSTIRIRRRLRSARRELQSTFVIVTCCCNQANINYQLLN